MNFIFKKNDSAISLLLFIYNNYLELTHKQTIRLTSLLQYMRAFGKNDSAVRMALSRATKAGLLTNSKLENEVYYSLTNDGLQAIKAWNEGAINFWKRYRLRNEAWDGKWYFVNLHSAQERKEGRFDFSIKMKQLGFILVNENTWASPFLHQEEVQQLIEAFSMQDAVIEIHGEINVHTSLHKFVDDMYEINKFRSMYANYIEVYKPKHDEFKKLHGQEKFIMENGHALPLLNDLGWNFFRIVSEDFVLPKQLWPHWEQDEAVALFKDFRGMLLPHVQRFLTMYE